MVDHYYSASPSVPSRPTEVKLRLADMELALVADAGVFSATRVDPGTVALLKEAGGPPAAGDIVDLGCGYGAIACALARRSPGTTVWAVDVNARARELATANASRLGLDNVKVVPPEEVPSGLCFAGLWSNPPIRVGKAALHELLGDWLGRVGPGAPSWLVVNRHLGGDSLAEWLRSQGWGVERAASKSGYRVLKAWRDAPGAPS